jgi:hypothetical protein
MGFRPQPTIYNLTFEGTALDGLHVKMSCCSLGEYNEMLMAAVSSPEPDDEGNIKISPDLLKDNDRILELFRNHLVSWDLEDLAGQPVPTDQDGIDSQERTIITQLMMAWQTAMVAVPNPSKTESSDGSTSVEQSLGLGSASESL